MLRHPHPVFASQCQLLAPASRYHVPWKQWRQLLVAQGVGLCHPSGRLGRGCRSWLGPDPTLVVAGICDGAVETGPPSLRISKTSKNETVSSHGASVHSLQCPPPRYKGMLLSSGLTCYTKTAGRAGCSIGRPGLTVPDAVLVAWGSHMPCLLSELRLLLC